MRRFTSPFFAAITGAVVTAIIVGGVAIAQTSAPGVITACVAETGGNVRIVSSASDCRANETTASWNQQGPQGQPGLPGQPRFTATLHSSANQVDCVHTGEFIVNECAAVTVHVPANKSYVAGINSAGSLWDSSDNEALICPSARRAADPPAGGVHCYSTPSGTTFGAAGGFSSVASSAAAVLTGGPSGTDWIIGTYVHTNRRLGFHPGAEINTLVLVSEVG
jgi:hypothetical protein